MIFKNMKTSSGLSEKWKKAAIIGGLWASIEIVIGSFLHNMRIPFAGSILAIQGIIILLSFISFWPERGLIIRAGIITALMKSISPSAIILGPMTGILTEALLLELFILILGRNIFGYIISSAIALSSALFHKIITFIILYGFDIVMIYKNIYKWFQTKTGIHVFSSFEFILLVLGIYILWGMIAGVIGFIIGKRTKNYMINSSEIIEKEEFTDDFFPIKKGQKFYLSLLIFNLLSVPFGLLLLNLINIWLGLAYMLFYSFIAIIYYKSSMRRLKKPIFWFQLIVIIILAAFFGRTSSQHQAFLSPDGFLYGIELSFRALFVVISFTALSVELRNPQIQKYLNSSFIKSLYEALSIAFAILPKMIKSLPRVKDFFTQPLNTFSKLIAMARYDYEKKLKI